MRLSLACAGFAAAFAAGLLAQHLIPAAGAQTPPPPLQPRIINLSALTEDEIGPLAAGADLRSRLLVATPDGTVSVQSGNVIRHSHANTDEIQLILAGEGSFWLGDTEQQVKPGDLVVIPRGTVHAGSRASSGRFRALAIKLPPQRAGDTQPAP